MTLFDLCGLPFLGLSSTTVTAPRRRARSLTLAPACVTVLFLLIVSVAARAAAPYEPYPQDPELLPVHESSTPYELSTLTDELWLPVAGLPLGDGSGRLLISSLEGQLWLVDGTAVRPEPFLDLVGRVVALEGEQGLFTAALEPSARPGQARRVFVSYTENRTGDLLLSSFSLATDLSGAARDTEKVHLRIEMPEPYHHGGQVAFGPDGMLYFSVGSGEISNEKLYVQPAPTQDLGTPLGKVLRFDASGDDLMPAPGNPFAATSGALPEVWALGLRNPWKFTFAPNGDLYVADVGMDRWEEVNVVEAGGNYGWPAREGYECVRFPDFPAFVEPDCPTLNFDEPLLAYAHLRLDPNGGQAVTGGVVVRDPALPGLAGRYVFGDFVSQRLWSYDLTTDRMELLVESPELASLTEVFEGEDNELLMVTISGRLMRLVKGD